MLFSERALQLIIRFEGLNQPGKWPGGHSGITLGYGYDLGYTTSNAFGNDWAACFTPREATRLHQTVGKKGQAAKALAPALADIRCQVADARRVLMDATLPAYIALTRRTFPGFDVLPLDVQGALVSLVYNRGASMTDAPGTDNRREMRVIRDLVASGTIAGISEQLRSMKRLWVGKNLDGLIRRREAEAQLVDSAIRALLRALRAAPGRLRPTRGSARARRAQPDKWLGASRKALVIAPPRVGRVAPSPGARSRRAFV